MVTRKRMQHMPLLLALALAALLVLPAAGVAAAVPTVNLKTTAGFAILAGTTITNTGPTTITGDVGLSPGSAFVNTGVTLNGATHIADAVAVQAKSDLVDVYNDAAGRPVTNNVQVELGGRTLGPGVYSSGGVFGITGTLTLNAKGDPNAVFIFQSASTLTTASGSAVRLINGARFCRVFWVVPSSATLGTNSTFVGHIFAVTDIVAKTGATVQGQLLAQNGEVTLDTNTITNGICAPIVTPKVTLALSGLKKGVVKIGREVLAKGKVTPTSLAGSKVMITVQRKSGGKWRTVKRVMRKISTKGTYFWRYLPVRSGTYRMRTTIAKTSTRSFAASQRRGFKAVRVRIPPFTG
jgi:hypothetical protein